MIRAAVELGKFPHEIEASWTDGDLWEFEAYLKIKAEAEREAMERARRERR